jgi:hypothetical protein
MPVLVRTLSREPIDPLCSLFVVDSIAQLPPMRSESVPQFSLFWRQCRPGLVMPHSKLLKHVTRAYLRDTTRLLHCVLKIFAEIAIQ